MSRETALGENKTWVHFPLHVAPSLPGSGVFSPPLGVFTECISAAFTRIWGQFASNSVNFGAGGVGVLVLVVEWGGHYYVLSVNMHKHFHLLFYDQHFIKHFTNALIPN